MIEFLNETPLEKPLIFDTHAHYDDERFDEIRDELLSSFDKNGVGAVISCGCDKKSSIKALEMAEKYDNVYVICVQDEIEKKYPISVWPAEKTLFIEDLPLP